MAKISTIAGLMAMSALVAACGGAESEKKADAPAAPAAPAAPVTAAPAPAPAAAPAGAPAAADVATIDGTQFASFTGTAAAGRAVFAQCRTCHVTDPGVNRIGPSLAGIIGRAAGTVPGFAYSPANSGSGITWTKEKLFQYLENPQRVVPGTKMIFPGIPDAQRRADVIAYLEAPT